MPAGLRIDEHLLGGGHILNRIGLGVLLDRFGLGEIGIDLLGIRVLVLSNRGSSRPGLRERGIVEGQPLGLLGVADPFEGSGEALQLVDGLGGIEQGEILLHGRYIFVRLGLAGQADQQSEDKEQSFCMVRLFYFKVDQDL
jgi:hypothetical protein